MIAIHARRLFDGTGTDPYGPATLLVENDQIAAIGPSDAVTVSQGVRVIDLDDLTLLPGLVDAHTHFGLAFETGGSRWTEAHSDFDVLLRAVKNARDCLRSGVTTVRTLGERAFLDVAYRNAIREGWIDGPRTLIAARALQPSHAHIAVSDVHADGPDAVRRAVRENVLAGADVIKLYLTPASASPTPTMPHFTRAEIEAGIDEAHRCGKPVAAHCHGGSAADDAIAAGVDTIEHGLFLTREQLERMAEQGTWLVATQTIRLWRDDESGFSEPLKRARAATGPNVVAAREAGVKITIGTDSAHGLMSFELECLVRIGFSPKEALLAGTRDAAVAIGLGASAGTLEVGKWADVIGVAGDPMGDVSVLKDVAFVMKGGKVFHPADDTAPIREAWSRTE